MSVIFQENLEVLFPPPLSLSSLNRTSSIQIDKDPSNPYKALSKLSPPPLHNSKVFVSIVQR
jgi:hypothetical protein